MPLAPLLVTTDPCAAVVLLAGVCLLVLQVIENAVAAVKHLRSLGCNDIEFSPEDAGRWVVLA